MMQLVLRDRGGGKSLKGVSYDNAPDSDITDTASRQFILTHTHTHTHTHTLFT